MSDLAGFLLARIDEDESYAREAWIAGRFDEPRVLAECEAKRRIVIEFGSRCSDYVDPDNPEDVAREMEFREYVGESTYQSYVKNGQRTHWPAGYSAFCDGCAAAQAADSGHEKVLRLLALPYADHPDYREEWRA